MEIFEGTWEGYEKFYQKVPQANRSLFNSPQFLSYREPNPLTIINWSHKGTSFAQSACWIKQSKDGSRTISIPGGASFGGPVARSRMGITDYIELLNALVGYARTKRYSRIEWTPSMRHHIVGGDDEAEFAALLLGFSVEVVGIESVVTLPANYDSKFTNLLRKCQREGVSSAQEIGLDVFYPTLEAVYARHQVQPTHSKSELALLKERFPREIRFVGATKDGEIAATACLFRISEVSEMVFYMCTVEKYKKDNPMMLLISEDMKHAQQQGCRTYNFGTSSIGLQLRGGVWSFKQQFGARGYMRRKLVWQST